MDLYKYILSEVKRKGKVKTSDITSGTGFSRAYIHRYLKELTDNGEITLIGKSNKAHYVLNSGEIINLPLKIHKILNNRGISEDKVLRRIKAETSIFNELKDNLSSILDYAFTEMLNNAIEHSRSEKIDISMRNTASDVKFTVLDRGIGIFKNIRETKKLKSEIEAIQDLLKGKETTAPSNHSGEGIFFTSKIADHLTIKSFEKMLVFDNKLHDVYVKNIRSVNGTKIEFLISSETKKNLPELFSLYTDESYNFNKTTVKVKLFKQEVDYVSRSQARRLVAGLEKFKIIELDYSNVDTVGQAFADEIYRVWSGLHKDIKLLNNGVNENIHLMINRAKNQVDSL